MSTMNQPDFTQLHPLHWRTSARRAYTTEERRAFIRRCILCAILGLAAGALLAFLQYGL